ncbi:hypothetical protein QR680_010269 [Steinernema hermaphroditum]|uniref:ShKT domain-containing protein n=1 Tax=Steinernema hermaphroditum TaxID=289476 RepID=A0AA39IQ09_9BILA|nr:hypothetical protein QR680_010269 [Steinernema hermaphroditum]
MHIAEILDQLDVTDWPQFELLQISPLAIFVLSDRAVLEEDMEVDVEDDAEPMELTLLFIVLSCINDRCGEGLMCNRETETCEQCRDKIPWCAKNKRHCNHYRYEEFLAENCAVTCGVCTPGPISPPLEESECEDKSRHCKKNARNCDNPKFKEFLSKSCPRTCQICSAPLIEPPKEQCFDSLGADTCQELKNHGFCQTSSIYNRERDVKFLCGQTCGCCDGQGCGFDGLVAPPEEQLIPPPEKSLIPPPTKSLLPPPERPLIEPPLFGGSPSCGDNFRGKGSCAQFKRRGYCRRVAFYGLEHVKRNCGVTCGLC